MRRVNVWWSAGFDQSRPETPPPPPPRMAAAGMAVGERVLVSESSPRARPPPVVIPGTRGRHTEPDAANGMQPASSGLMNNREYQTIAIIPTTPPLGRPGPCPGTLVDRSDTSMRARNQCSLSTGNADHPNAPILAESRWGHGCGGKPWQHSVTPKNYQRPSLTKLTDANASRWAASGRLITEHQCHHVLCLGHCAALRPSLVISSAVKRLLVQPEVSVSPLASSPRNRTSALLCYKTTGTK